MIDNRLYFDPSITEDNDFATVNTDITSEDILLPYSPRIYTDDDEFDIGPY